VASVLAALAVVVVVQQAVDPPVRSCGTSSSPATTAGSSFSASGIDGDGVHSLYDHLWYVQYYHLLSQRPVHAHSCSTQCTFGGGVCRLNLPLQAPNGSMQRNWMVRAELYSQFHLQLHGSLDITLFPAASFAAAFFAAAFFAAASFAAASF
jgi:hypothetical protein